MPTPDFMVKAKIGAKYRNGRSLRRTPLVILPQKGPVNQDQKSGGKHQNADSIDPVHHSQVEIPGLMSAFGFKDFYKVG